MIVIEKSRILSNQEKMRFTAIIKDTFSQKEREIYFQTDKNWGGYFVDNQLDAFVVSMIPRAVVTNQDITIKGNMSARLYYNLVNCTIPAYCVAQNKEPINVHVEGKLVTLDLQPTANATGCSLGVDSFASMLQHLGENCPDEFKLTHLTFFNVGFGTNMEKAKGGYEKTYEMVSAFAKAVKLPVVCVDSNMSEINMITNKGVSTMLFNIASTVLSMPGLFKNYYIASSYHIKFFNFSQEDPFDYEAVLTPSFSNGLTNFSVANLDMDRSDKTRFLSTSQLAQNYLYVCWKDHLINDYGLDYCKNMTNHKPNCSSCEKCRRTMITLDILGKLDLFAAVFDVNQYKKNKDAYQAFILAHKERYFHQDIIRLAKKCGYNFSLKSRLGALVIRSGISSYFHKYIARTIYQNK